MTPIEARADKSEAKSAEEGGPDLNRQPKVIMTDRNLQWKVTSLCNYLNDEWHFYSDETISMRGTKT